MVLPTRGMVTAHLTTALMVGDKVGEAEVGHVLTVEAYARALLDLTHVTRREPGGLSAELVEVVRVALLVHVLDPDLLLGRHPPFGLLPGGLASDVVVVVVSPKVVAAELPARELHLLERGARGVLRVARLLRGHLGLEHASLLRLFGEDLELSRTELEAEHLALEILAPPVLEEARVERAEVVEALLLDGHEPAKEALLELAPVE
mmetsp:Transcript_20080/g.52520  ORF Transcript_20080/g.52520 Transcript_20080/m.52520 type:complete len:206 (-) Transcript_20080:492-1109(-)